MNQLTLPFPLTLWVLKLSSVTIKDICNILDIEKYPSSAYHSQGNGFAEQNISSIKDILRSILLARNVPQYKWQALLPENVVALNTSISKAAKQIKELLALAVELDFL